ncbi:DnaJ subfamily C member 28 [Choanephora cucurbitarum]|uniref:DnaJ subfamily C member 28 n=1 Tax=Choanephora cucurbitarum TaxID=101091 RepID=A0A1C7N9I9_9FUNG|nr:DnaJ subfamily C member 28 [Choanephora cucurbitarum]
MSSSTRSAYLFRLHTCYNLFPSRQSLLRKSFYSTSQSPPRNIFEPSEEDKDEKATSITKKQQLPNDKPWDGDEPVSHSVLRMIMDKYRAPLRVEGAARRNIPQPQSNFDPSSFAPQKKEKSSQEKKIERDNQLRKRKQNRITSARDAAFDYAMDRKYPTTSSQSDTDWDEWETNPTLKGIEELGQLTDAKIRSARAKGAFDNLPGRGKPIETDPMLSNPFVDRTEYFMNRIIQRNGAAPPWVIMQQEVDIEVKSLRSQMSAALKRCIHDIRDRNSYLAKPSLIREFEKLEKSYFAKEVDRVNSKLKSYNVMCPSPVRKQLLELEKELEWTLEKLELERN